MYVHTYKDSVGLYHLCTIFILTPQDPPDGAQESNAVSILNRSLANLTLSWPWTWEHEAPLCPCWGDWRQPHSSLACVPESPPCYPLLIVQCNLNSSHAPWSVCSTQVCHQSPNFTFNSYSSLRLPQIFLVHHFRCATCTQWALGY